MTDLTTAIEKLQTRLQARAQPTKRAWWERYLKHVIQFRGVPMADIRQEVRGWIPADGRVELALALIREPVAEDKLAGVLVLAEHVVPSGEISSAALLRALPPLFADGYITDWNTCDWLCVKVLHGVLIRDGEAIAPLIAAWQRADTLWQRRAAAVAFVKLAPRGDHNWPGFVEQLLAVCAANAQDPVRFSQTGVGWALRELSKADPDAVAAFADLHPLSREARNMALAKITGGLGHRFGQVVRREREIPWLRCQVGMEHGCCRALRRGQAVQIKFLARRSRQNTGRGTRNVISPASPQWSANRGGAEAWPKR